jgi:beta-glucosidase
MKGDFPPGRRNALEWRRVTETMIEAHEAALRAVKGGRGEPLAGICLQLPDYEPARDDPACVAACEAMRRQMSDVFIDGLQGDFVGVQYYSRMRVDPATPSGFAPPPPDATLTQMGWEIHPEGLYRALAEATRSGLPALITENGIATDDDAQRIDYLHDHLAQVKRALDDGIDVRGYICWSAFDNFEWNEGYRPRFGLIGIDRENELERIVHPSARAFGELSLTGRLAAFREAVTG